MTTTLLMSNIESREEVDMQLQSLAKPTLAAFLLVVSGCGSTPAENGDCQDGASAVAAGDFTMTISGAQILELCGLARWGDAGSDRWFLQLLTTHGESSIHLSGAKGEGRPLPSTYTIADYIATETEPLPNQFVASIGVADSVLGATGFSSIGGTLTITSSTEDRVSGEFDMQARNSQGTVTISVTGRFNATNGDV